MLSFGWVLKEKQRIWIWCQVVLHSIFTVIAGAERQEIEGMFYKLSHI